MAIHRLVILLVISTISVDAARPCKTILFITSSSSSSSSSSSFPSNENPDLLFPNPRFITFSYTTTQPLHKNIPTFMISDRAAVNPVSNSIRDRTLDILSILSALLFGVGCGALTAATMYLVWFVCSARTFHYESDSDDDEVSAAKKKLGYVALPVLDVHLPPSVNQVD